MRAAVLRGLGDLVLTDVTVQALGAWGVDRVVGIDNSPFRSETAARTGAAAVPDFDGMAEAVRLVAGPGLRGQGGGANAVLEASGAAPLLTAAPSLLRSGGRLGLVALYKQPIALDMNEWVTRELELVGCYGYAAEFGDAPALVAGRQLDPSLMLTATVPAGLDRRGLRGSGGRRALGQGPAAALATRTPSTTRRRTTPWSPSLATP